MGYVPELDSLRGLAIILVLAFHGGWGWMSGGYVGVSLFFTLSGFLVTGLLLDEFDRNGRVDTRRFLVRRMRRLLPASLACLSAVAVLGTFGAFGSQPELGRDLTGAATQLANWFALAGDTSYAEQVLNTRSPLDHFWSLSIEEQFYWIWPFALGFAVRRSRVAVSVVIATVFGFAAAIWIAAAFGPDAAYWASPARAGEVLVGATLAVLVRRQLVLGPRATGTIGVLGLTVVLWAATTWPAQGGPAYSGWLPFFAVGSASLVYAARAGDRSTPLRSMLRMPPLVGLGKISYGTYLYHWPIFLLVDRVLDQGPQPTAWKFSIQVVVTLAIALISSRWLERPLRAGVGRDRTVAAMCAGATIVVLAIAALGTFGPADRFADPPQLVTELSAADPIGTLEPLAPVVSTTADDQPRLTTVDTSPPVRPAGPEDAILDVPLEAVPTRPVRIMVLGDSTAWSMGDGLEAWAEDNPSLATVELVVSPGCGLLADGHVAEWSQYDDLRDLETRCRDLHERLPATFDARSPDVVVIMVTIPDLLDRVWDDAEGPLDIFTSEFRTRLTARYTDFGQALIQRGTATLWIKAPAARLGSDQALDPRRTDAFHEVIDEVVSSFGDRHAEVIDLEHWLGASDLDGREARPDGVHLGLDAATEIADRCIGPSLVNLALRSAGS